MPSKICNELGTITISNEVIAKIAGFTAISCYGIVGMAARNVKDGLVQLLKKESLTKGVRLVFEGNALHISFHIIVEYGTNIAAIGECLVSNVTYLVNEYTGIEVAKINIYVEGIRVS